VLGSWIPPAPGVYEATLTARDKAGNVRSSRVFAASTLRPALTAFSAEPRYISPNGDGVQDKATIRFSVNAAVSTRFDVVNSAGKLVRSFSRTLLQPGDDSFDWDGTDASGSLVADGEYLIRCSDGGAVQVGVDLTPPKAYFSWSNQAEKTPIPYILTATQSQLDSDVDGRTVAQMLEVTTTPPAQASDGSFVQVAQLGLRDLWQGYDRLEGSPVETLAAVGPEQGISQEGPFAALADPAVPGEIANVTELVKLTRTGPICGFGEPPPLPLSGLRGEWFRARAVDRAGNVTSTRPHQIPRALYALGIGDAAELDPSRGTVTVAGEVLPRVDRLMTLYPQGLGADCHASPPPDSRGPFFQPGKLGIHVQFTGPERIVSFAVRYPTVTGAPATDWQNVTWLAPGALIWDASYIAWDVTHIEVIGTDELGREWSAPIDFAIPPRDMAVSACASVSGNLRLAFSGVEGQVQSARVELYAAGARLPEQVNVLGASDLNPSDPNGVTVPSRSLSQCRYRANLVLTTSDGRMWRGGTSTDVCTFEVRSPANMIGRELHVDVANSFRGIITSLDAYAVPVRQPTTRIPVGTIASAQNLATLSFDASRLPACMQGTLQFVVHFWNAPDYDSANDDASCGLHSSSFSIPCDSISVAEPAPPPPAPSCTIQKPDFTIAVGATTARAGGKIVQLHAALRSAQNLETQPLALDAFEPAATVATAAHVASAPLAEGIYFIGAAALDSGGDRAVHGFDPEVPGAPLARNPVRLIVDRTPPVATIANPADGARVCAIQATSPDGRATSVFRVLGTVSDAHLTDFLVEMAPLGESFDPYFASDWIRGRSSATIAADVDLAGLAARDYRVRLVARDVSGSSGCSPPVTVHLDPAVRLSAFSADDRVFSPDGDGVSDVAKLRFHLDESAAVKLEAQGADGTFSPALVTNASFGDSVLTWDGTLASGSRLADGDWLLRLTATDGCANTSAASTHVGIDTAAPTVQIDSPVPGAAAAGQLLVRGRVDDANLTGYQVLLGSGSAPAQFAQVAASDHPDTGVLAAIDLTGLAAGSYVLRLAAQDSVGHATTADVPFVVGTPSLIAQLAAVPALYSSKVGGALAARVSLTSAASVRLVLEDSAGASLAVIADGLALAAGTSTIPVPVGSVSGLADGQYRLRLDAVSATAADSAETWLVLDATAPSIDGVLPVDQAVTPADVDVFARIADPHLVSWSVEVETTAGFVQVAGGSSAPASAVAQLRGLAEGPHRLRLRARDGAGNSNERIVPFTVDATPPVLHFVAPVDGDLLAGRADPNHVVLAFADAHPATLRLEAVRRADGSTRTLIDTATAGGTITVPWTVGSEQDGSFTLRATAEDAAGNRATASIGVTIDNDPPAVAIYQPGPGFLRDIYVIGAVTDENLASWTLEMARGPAATAAQFAPISGGSASGSVFAVLPQFPDDGTYTFRLSARDRADNEAATSVEVVADRTPPPPPQTVSAAVQNGRDILVSWVASAASDVTAYAVQRATGNGDFQDLATVSAPALVYRDAGLSDQSYRYRIVAVDAAGNASAPSSVAQGDVHASPPLAAISSPRPGTPVSGVVQITGTAVSAYAFKEYRLSVGAGAAPTSWTLLTRSAQPVAGGVLGRLDTLAFAQGSQQSILLEVEDTYGNHSQQTVTIAIDDVAPAAPVLLSATAQTSTVTVTWRAGGTDADVAGYLVYRNGAVANAPDAFTDLTPWLLPPTTTMWTDSMRPDGLYTYQVQAMDAAGNLSPLSNSIDVRIDLGAPAAHISSPEHLVRVTGPFIVSADLPDQDVTSVQLQVKAATASSFTTFATLKAPPWTAQVDPATLAHPAFEVRALATDASGKVDPAPAPVTIFYAPLPAVPLVQTHTDGSNVTVSWSLPAGGAPAAAVLASSPRYLLGTQLPLPSGTTSASVGNAAAGYDGNGSTYWQGAAPGAQYWQVLFSSPLLANGIRPDLMGAGTKVDVSVRVSGGWVRIGRIQRGYSDYVSPAIGLGGALLLEGVRLDFPDSYTSFFELYFDLPYVTATPTATETGAPTGNRTYTVQAISAFGQTAAGTASALIYAPDLDPVPVVVGAPDLTLTGCTAPGADAHVLVGATEVAVAPVGTDCRFTAHVPLATGTNDLTVRGIDASGNRSVPAQRSVLLDPAPSVALALTGAATTSTVDLTWTAQGDASNVDHLELWRAIGAGDETLLAALDAATRQYRDANLANGWYRYRVLAANAHGFTGAPSNQANIQVQVDPPPAPTGLAVTAPEEGSSLRLAWSEAAAVADYLIERADSAGSFQPIGTTATPAFTDAGLTNGATYSYRVRARDALGNASSPSAVARGVPADRRVPLPPVIDEPTTAGNPISLGASDTPVGGSAQPGTIVDVFRNGELIGSTPAVPGTRRTPIHISFPVASAYDGLAFDVKADGSRWAYLARVPGGFAAALETADGSLTTVDLGGAYPLGLALSPDGSKATVVASGAPNYRRDVQVIDFAARTATPLVVTPALDATAERFQAAWSPDSQAVAYIATEGYRPSVLAMAAVAGGAEQVIADLGSDSFRQLAWPRADAILAAVEGYYSGEWLRTYDVAGNSRTLYSGRYWTPRILASTPEKTAVLDRDYWPAKVRIAAVDGSGVTDATSIYSYSAVATFSADGHAFDWIASNQLWELELASGAVTSLGSVSDTWYSSPAGLFATTDGRKIVFDAYQGAFSMRQGNFWSIDSTPLAAGDNVFTARAARDGGPPSAFSEPVVVTVGAESLADLTVEPRLVPPVPAVGDPVSAVIRVRNIGAAPSQSANVIASVLGSDGSLRSNVNSVPPIDAGGYQEVAIPVDITGLRGLQTLVAAVQPLGRDANHDNDEKQMPFIVVSGAGITASLSLSSTQVGADGTVQASTLFVNSGPAVDATVRLRVLDTGGDEVFVVDSTAIPQFQGPDPFTASRTIAVGRTLAGDYQVVAEAVVAGAVVASAQVALRIVPDVNVSASAAPDKAVFAAGEVPSFRFHVQNRSRNSLLAGAVVIADVSDQQGANIFTTTIRMPTVLVGGSWDGSVELPPPGLPAGAYVGTVRVLQSGLELAAGSAAFEVAGEALLEGAIEIAGGRGSPPAIPSGSAATLHLLLTNSGTVPAAAVQIHVGVLDPQSLALLFSQDFSVDTIVPGDWHAEQAAVSTAGLALKTYAVSMTVAHDGGGPELIATRTFRVADAVAPVLSVPLAAGAFVRGKIGLAAHASDDASGVIAVSVSVDGAAALPLLLTAGTALDGDWRVKLSLADGPHTLFFSAVDAEGNLAALPPIPIVSDATAPSVAISGVADGALLASAVRPDVSVTDANLALVSVTLNATAWVPGSAVEPDGDYELVTSAVDRAGNEASRSVSFSIDRTAPEIAVLGVTDGQYSTADIAPVVQVRDRHPADAAAMLDGLPLPAGAPVTSEGTHFLEVDATDAAGNHSSATLRFTIDRTPPVVAWSGFFDGAVVAQSVVASFTASDANLASAWATANGRAFASGGTLSEEGTYVMVATAADRAGNQRSATATVTIDRTAPTIALRGFAPGSVGRTPVTPVIDVEDANLDHVDATLNGAPFVSGTTISAQGAYALLVTALDRAGNRATASATFTIDTTPPPVTLGGFVEGMVVRDDVSPTFSSSSADVTSVAAVLNGAPFVAGTVVHAEGAYTFTATATDAAGNRSSASGHFTIDRTPPEVTILGVRDGDALAGSLRPDFSVSDANLSYVIATLNNAPFTGGTTVIAEDQYTLVVRAVDKAGNRTERSVTFAIDRTAPSIWISGVADGAVVSTPVTLTFGANDLNQGTVSATLNGAVIASGTTLEAEGEYLLSVTATDRAGNTSRRDLRFAIDRTPPQIVVSGVSDGAYLSVASVVPTFTVTDPHPGTSSAKLDRVDFVSGTAVTSEMTHNLVVSAADRALNPASVSVTFTIDRTPPQIAISGVSDGVTYDDAVAPLVTISDANPDTSSILLNDQPFTSGTRISEDGTYTLSARAKDKAANSSSASVTFTILQVKYAVQHSLAAPGPVLALLRAGTCDLSAADQARIGAFLGSTFAGRIVSVATDDATFLSRFRSGLYRLLVRVNTGNAPDATCRQDADAGCASAACILRRTIDREVTEAVFSGRAGLIVLRDRTESLPGMREALGADSAGSISAGTLRFGPEPAFASLAPVAVPARAVRLDLIGAAEAAAYGEVTTPSAPLNSAGAAHHIFGAGQAVVFGFDLSASASTDSALAALSRSAQVVAPLPSALGPLGVAGVEIDVVNLAKATTTRVREFLPAQVQPLASLPATSLSANPLEWQLALDSSQGASFAWFARVPEQPGKYTVTTEVAALRPSGTRVFGSFPLDLQLSESARDLAANAVAATEDLPVSGHDGAVRTRILQTLAGVSARPIGSAADIELDIADLLSAVDDAKTLQSVDPTPVRLALDELIRYWEARWALQ
jgi:hypothetical protein